MRSLIAILLALWLAPAWTQVPMTGAGRGAPSSAMVSPITVTGNGAVPSSTSANYVSYAGGIWGTSVFRDAPISVSGAVSGLRVLLPTAVASGSYVFTLYKNQIATGLSCTIAASGVSCNDNTSVTVAFGDSLMWQSCPGSHSGVGGSCSASAATAQASGIAISAVFTSSLPNETFLTLGKAVAPSATVANYMFFGAPSSSGTWQATEASISGIMPTNGTISDLRVEGAAPGAAKSVTWTVYKNGSATALTCQMTGSGSGAGITFCSDTANSVSLSAGDTLSLESAVSGTPGMGNTGASLRFVPTVPGEAVSMNSSVSALSTGSTRWMALADGVQVGSETSSALTLVPVAFTLKKLHCALNAAPGAGAPSRTWVNRFGTGGGQSSGSISCSLTTTPSNSDTTHTYAASVDDLINWQETPANTPASNTYFKFSSVMATQ